MNSCEYYQELISTLVDGELSREESEDLMLHLNSCSRCNAMYAVFHDLSDILSEEPEPLPEGLHENIMAGVRRSALIKKNRRMRRIGLRTAMTAAACAVLVLFAAVGFNPGKRADSVSVRSAEEASQLMRTPAPAAESSAAPAAVPVPTWTSTPTWTPAPAPEQTPVPAEADAYYTAGGSTVTYTPVQPEQYNDYYAEDSAPTWTPVPVQTAAPLWTPEPAYIPAPAPMQTAAPVQTPADVLNQQTAAEIQTGNTEDLPVVETTPAAVDVPDFTASLIQAPAAVQSAENAESFQHAAEESSFVAEQTEQAVQNAEPETEPEPETEDAPTVFSFFSSMADLFDAAAPEQLIESKQAVPDAINDLFDALPADEHEESPAPVLDSMPVEIMKDRDSAAGDPMSALPAPSVREEHVSVYGSEARSRLLAMIGTSEDSLPQEAELTRLVHVSFIPDDAYGSEDTMDISIYGDFVYCSLHPVEGGSVTYRADCSLKELDSFLTASAATPAPSAAPTPDPYTIAETPAPVPDLNNVEPPVPTPNDADPADTAEA